MKKPSFAIALLLVAGSALADGDQTPSAQVQVVALRRMRLADRVAGFGAVAPEPNAAENLGFPKSGQVVHLDVFPGQQVHRGQALLEIATDPTAALSYDQAENALVFARSELERTQSLFEKRMATRSQVEAATKALEDAKQAEAAQRALGGARKNDRLKAPFDGLVVSLSVTPGDRFQAGANLVQVARTATLGARLGVEPEDSRRIRPGMDVLLASVFDSGDTVHGKVVRVAGQVDPQTRLVDVDVRFPGNSLLPGTQVRGAIATREREVLAVPRQAVLSDDEHSYIFQVVRGHAHRVQVEIGIQDGGWLEIRGAGLLDAPVVVLGNYELEDGMAVREEGR